MRIFLRKDQRHSAIGAVLPKQKWSYVFHLASVAMVARDFEARATIDDVRIEGIRSHIGVLVGSNGMPVVKRDLAVIASTQCARRAALLLAAIDPIRVLIIGDDVIELRGRLVVPRAPCASTVHRYRRALIDAQEDDVGIFRIDPDGVVIVTTRRAFPGGKGLPTIGRLV